MVCAVIYSEFFFAFTGLKRDLLAAEGTCKE